MLKAIGNSKLYFNLELLNKILIIVGIFMTYNLGIHMLIIGQIIIHNLCFIINSIFVGKEINYSFKYQIMNLLPCLFLSVIMGLIIHSISYISLFQNITLLTLQSLVGLLSYVFLCHIFKISPYMYILSVLRNKIK